MIAQLLDYGSWVRDLTYADLNRISQEWQGKSLSAAFEAAFDAPIPEAVNGSHSLILVASELDDSSERVIRYLADEYGVSITAVFFGFFQDGGGELLGRAWLRDPTEPEPRKHGPWSGEWFVNVGEGPHPNWDDNMKYGFISAGQGVTYSRPLRRLEVGDRLFAYMKGLGYVGYGKVTKKAAPIAEFVVESESKRLLDLPLKAPRAAENSDSPALSEWAVGMRWLKAYDRKQARTFKGVFANQNVVCKLRDVKILEFLRSEFAQDLSPEGT